MPRYPELKHFYNGDTATIQEAAQKTWEANSRLSPDDPVHEARQSNKVEAVMPLPSATAVRIVSPENKKHTTAIMPLPSAGTKQITPAQKDAVLSLWNDTGEWIGQVPPQSIEYKYKLFIDEYLIDYDHVRAAIAAGFCADRKFAAQEGNHLRTKLAPVIAARTKTLAGRCGVYAENIIKEIDCLANSNMAAYEPVLRGNCHLSDLPVEAQKAVKKITVKALFDGKGLEKDYVGDEIKIELYDKLDALKVLGSHLGVINKESDNGGGGAIPGQSSVNIILYSPHAQASPGVVEAEGVKICP